MYCVANSRNPEVGKSRPFSDWRRQTADGTEQDAKSPYQRTVRPCQELIGIYRTPVSSLPLLVSRPILHQLQQQDAKAHPHDA